MPGPEDMDQAANEPRAPQGEQSPEAQATAAEAEAAPPAEADDVAADPVDDEVAEAVEPEVVDPHAPLLAQIRDLEDRLHARETQLRQVSKAFRDLEDDMEAFRQRSKHAADIRAERKSFETIEKFFEPVQNLRRALDAGGDAESLKSGVQMVLHQFAVKLDELGVQEVPGVGSPFDPNVHEALAIMPVTDPSQDGQVLVVHSTGYLVGSKVLQAAQVVIGKYQETAGEA